MKAVSAGKYRQKGTGKIVYRYEITGTAEEKAAFLASKAAAHSRETGDVVVADNGNPLYFTSRFEGAERDASISEAGNLSLADTEATVMARLAEEQATAGNTVMARIYAEKAADLQLAEVKEALRMEKEAAKETVTKKESDLNP